MSSLRSRRSSLASAVWGLALAAALALSASTAQAADTCPNAKYRTGPSLKLPDCRAYEMVTPIGKANALIQNLVTTINPTRISEDGDTVLFMASGGPMSADGTIGMPTYERARRGENGWSIEPAMTPVLAPYVDQLPATPGLMTASRDLGTIAFVTSTIYDPEQLFVGVPNRNGSVHLTNGSDRYWWVSKPTWEGASPVQGDTAMRKALFVPVGGSDSMDVFYFNSAATLTPEDGTSGRNALESWAVYKFEDGKLSNAAVLPDGSLSQGGSVGAGLMPDALNLTNLPNGSVTERSRANPVSRDGKSLLFVSPDPRRAAQDPSLPKPQLYRAVAGKQTQLVSAPEGKDEPVDGTQGVARTAGLQTAGSASTSFALATPDHSVIVFSSRDALTDDADPNASISKTYRLETETGALTYLPDLDRPYSASGLGAPIDLDESGDALLYRTSNNVLKLWRKGKPTRTISTSVSELNSPVDTSITHTRFAAGGDIVIINSTGALRGEPDHTPGSNGPAVYRSQVYRYDAQTDELKCISCQEGGTPGGASISMWGVDNGFTSTTNSAQALMSTRSLTPDGSAIYFTSRTALVEDDHNDVADVYEWRDGELRLISSGATGALPQYLIDIDADGSSVFFATEERLVEHDTDDMYDIYVARVNGGLEPPAAQSGTTCSGDECQGSPGAGPEERSVASVDFTGSGNVHEEAAASVSVARLGRTAGPVARLRVRVPSAGRIVTNGRFVRRSARHVPKAGAYVVRVALSSQARRQLRRRGLVTAQIRVAFQTSEGRAARNLRLVFKQGKAKRANAAGRGSK
jgi:hypothetical protein